ncbi:MAG: hypothetical protein K6E28_06615 [Eubacterium sp.]|nr:hypothetical protein [Eubacterium sp.]
MKVDETFYSDSNSTINNSVEAYESCLEEFNRICAEIFAENYYGVLTQEVLQELYLNIYNMLSGKLTTYSQKMINDSKGYVNSISEDDRL